MSDSPRILVIGAGYVGLVTAVALAKLGHRIELVEAREDRLSLLAGGRAPIFERGVEDILGPAVGDGRITLLRRLVETPAPLRSASASARRSLTTARVISRQLTAAIEMIRSDLDQGAALVIRSTTQVGATRRVIEDLGLPEARCSSTQNSFAKARRSRTSSHRRGWSLGGSARATMLVREVEAITASIEAPRLRVTFEEAEIIKNAANAFLALKLSFTNELQC